MMDRAPDPWAGAEAGPLPGLSAVAGTDPEAEPLPANEGAGHLRRIARFQAVLALLGAALWGLHSGRAALVFLVGSLTSVIYWQLHQLIVVRMLSPQLRRRWFYGVLTLFKLALIVLALRETMLYYPLEVLPLVTGILLFNASIMMEAVWLVWRPDI